MKNVSFIIKYLKYLISAKSAHGIHSPFVFDLYNEVLKKKSAYYFFDKIELMRRQLLLSNKEIEVLDLGTGRSGKRRVGDIIQKTAKSETQGQLLFRLAYRCKPLVILELGTSLGISTSYLAAARPEARVITIEGSPEIAKLARKNFDHLKLNNVEVVVGNLDTELEKVLSPSPPHPSGGGQAPPQSPVVIHPVSVIGLAFFDANHRKEPTLRYFSKCLEHAGDDSIFIFDDIHWSDEMEEAWEEIKAHPAVTVTVDLFFAGLVFFRKEQEKQHFVLRY